MNEQRFRDLRFGLDEKFVFLRGLQVWKLVEANLFRLWKR